MIPNNSIKYFFILYLIHKYFLVSIILYIIATKYPTNVDKEAAYNPIYGIRTILTIIFIAAEIIVVFAISNVFLVATYTTPNNPTITLNNDAIKYIGIL